MSDFWSSTLGEVTGKPEDAFAKTFKHIPDGTTALAKINSFKKETDQGGINYFNLEWQLIEGDFKGQKVNQKLKVWGNPDDKEPGRTKHRALNMLKLLYQLYNIRPKNGSEPSDQDLSSFVGRIAGILIRETEPNQEGKSYNWVAEVHNSQGFKSETGIKLEVVHSRENLETAFSRNPKGQEVEMDSDIPF